MTAPVSIFVSHKLEDSKAAIEIKHELEKLCSKRLAVFISEEIPPGARWLEEIMKAISDARLFLMLLTGPRPTWDWTLLELGLFIEPATWGDSGHVVCLHHVNSPIPDAVSSFQTLSVDGDNLDQLTGFLKRLYGDAEYVGTPDPINPELAAEQELLTERAAAIAKYFEDASARPHFPHMRLVLDLSGEENLDILQNDEVLHPDTKIADDDGVTLPTLFGFKNDGNATWHDIVSRSEARGFTAWCDQLGAACAAGARNETSVAIQATLRTVQGGTIFRPILYRVDAPGKTRRRFHVLFEPEAAPHSFAGSDALGKLYNQLRLSHRFRGEVLNTYRGNMAELAKSEGAEQACRRLGEVIALIETDAESQSLLETDTLVGPHATEEHKKKAEDILVAWQTEIRPGLLQAIDEGNIEDVERFLAALGKLNLEFLALCSASYAEIAKGLVEPAASRKAPSKARRKPQTRKKK